MKTKLRFFASGIKKNIVYLNMLPEAKQNPGKHEFKLSLVQISKSNDWANFSSCDMTQWK